MPRQVKTWAVVPAAGIGRRMMSDRPKQYLPLAERRVLDHTLAALCGSPSVDGVVVGLRDSDPWWREQPFEHNALVGVSPGGDERANTVLKGLGFLEERAGAAADDWVMVHDAVRPCLNVADIERLAVAAVRNGGGALLALKVVDTLKVAGPDGDIESTPDRESLWRAMTPQMFRLGALQAALEDCLAAGVVPTDESQAMERAGVRPTPVPCDPTNIKITLPADLELAALYLERRP